MPIQTLRPNEVTIREPGILTATLGHAELEQAAACIVHYHRVKGMEDWTPIRAGDFIDFMGSDAQMRAWGRNPFWRPDFFGLPDAGWVEGWTFKGTPDERKAEMGIVTPKFIAAVSNPRIGPGPHVTLEQLEATFGAPAQATV